MDLKTKGPDPDNSDIKTIEVSERRHSKRVPLSPMCLKYFREANSNYKACLEARKKKAEEHVHASKWKVNRKIGISEKGKESCTASKLGSPNAYHHCTVLVDVNKVNLRQALQKQTMGISTNATQSMPSPVMNLCEVNSHINMEQLFSAVGWEFLRTCPQSMQDGGHDLISQQYGFQMVNPTEGWFPGLEKSREELASWDWRFGKTPKFTVTRSFRVPEELTEDSMADEELRIKLDINNGIIEDITLQIPPGFMSASGFHGDASVITNLRGCRLVSGRRDCRVTKVRGARRATAVSVREACQATAVSLRGACQATAVSVRGTCQAIKLLHGWGRLGLRPNSHEKSSRGSAILGPEGMVAGVESDALVQSGKSVTKNLIVL
uniref:BPL/LPL catalytic domain-containing protein n=1 Tax=Timema cristinae TaxID=61476 RepID=A0A7R9GQQ8_TIMCR|nr:unnamed protein product [Timema cristinae]